MAVYPTNIITEMYLDDVWVDVSAYVIGNITGKYGFNQSNNYYNNRVADIGDMKLTLNNLSGAFTLNGMNALSGFNYNVPLRVSVVYNEITKKIFQGKVTKIVLDDIIEEFNFCYITVSDFFYDTVNTPLDSPDIQTDSNTWDAMLFLGLFSGNPAPIVIALEYDGLTRFPSIFDTTGSKTTSYNEFNRLISSEFGYIYLNRKYDYSPLIYPIYHGDNLIIEDKSHRDTTTLTEIPLDNSTSGFLLKSDGFHLLQQNGDKILLSQTSSQDFDNNMFDAEVEIGSSLINNIRLKFSPRKVDTSNVVLYSLGSPQLVLAGQTLSNLRGDYVDLTGGGAKVNGKNMVTPVATTDYLMFANSDGTGTNLTANLAVTATYTPTGVTYSLHNTGGTDGYVTLLQARGLGIYTYASIEYVDEDTTSEVEFGTKQVNMDAPYLGTIDSDTTDFINRLKVLKKNPLVDLKNLQLKANNTNGLMLSFLYYDIGDLIHVSESSLGVDSKYWIMGKEFTITPDKEITFKLIVTQALIITGDYWLVGVVGQSEVGETTIVGHV